MLSGESISVARPDDKVVGTVGPKEVGLPIPIEIARSNKVIASARSLVIHGQYPDSVHGPPTEVAAR